MHASILAYMFSLVENNKLTVKLSQNSEESSNLIFVQQYVANLLKTAFNHLQNAQIRLFVKGLFSLNHDIPQFKSHLRDFLIQIKEYAGEDTSDLFLEEREQALPGILNPHDISIEMQD